MDKKGTKVIAIGIGYNHNGTKYEYPIYTKKGLEQVKRVGGEIK